MVCSDFITTRCKIYETFPEDSLTTIVFSTNMHHILKKRGNSLDLVNFLSLNFLNYLTTLNILEWVGKWIDFRLPTIFLSCKLVCISSANSLSKISPQVLISSVIFADICIAVRENLPAWNDCPHMLHLQLSSQHINYLKTFHVFTASASCFC